MKFEFQEETAEGVIHFSGELTPVDVNYLLQYALMDLIQKGAIMSKIKVIEVEDEDPTVRH